MPWHTASSEGGVTQVVVNLIRQFRKIGPNAAILGVCSWHDKRFRVVDESLGRVAYIRLWFPDEWKAIPSYIANIATQIRAARDLLRHEQISVVNIHYVGLSALTFVFVRKLALWRGKLILSFHGSDMLAARKASKPKRYFWHVLLANADQIVAPSNSLAAQLRETWPTVSSKLSVVHNGVDIDVLKEMAERSYSCHQRLLPSRYILSIGTLERKKGHDVLLRAFQKVHARHPAYQLIIVGRPGGFEGTLRSLANELRIEQNVQIIEGIPHDKIGPFYRSAVIFALPSRYEPFGIVALEAGAFGVPVVASSIDGIQEIIRNHIDGLLVPPEDPTSLADAICTLLDNPDLRLSLAANLRERVEAYFSWNQARTAYEKLYLSTNTAISD